MSDIELPRARPEIRQDIARLADASMWRSLDEATLASLFDAGEILNIDAGEHLIRAGEDYKQCIYVHLEGRLEQTSGNGDVRHAEPGDIIGLAGYLDGDNYRSTAHADTACRVLSIPTATIQRLERESPAFFEAVNRALASRMRKARTLREAVRGTLARPAEEIMRPGLVTCRASTTLEQACRMLLEQHLDSLGVVDEDDRLLGVVTPMSIAQAMALDGAARDDDVHGSSMEIARTATPGTPLWVIEQIQQRQRAREVIVVNEAEAPVGTVSQAELNRALAAPPQSLDSEIRSAPGLDVLAQLRQRIPAAARRVHESNRSVGAAIRSLTELHLALQHRCIELVLEEMESEGHGPAPARFALIIMGSGGRGEMLLRPDQDNGLIIGDDVDEDGMAWFRDMAERLNPALDRIGYRLCPGDVMARNLEYRRTLSDWKARIDGLIADPGRADARWSSIVFDFATQYGDDRLTSDLRVHLNDRLADGNGRMLFRMMASDDAESRHPLGLFNRLITTRHEGRNVIDIKRTGLRILVDGVRVFALGAGISRTKTLERIASLRRHGVFDREFSETMRIAFEELQDLLFAHQLAQADRGETPNPLIDVDELSSYDLERLRVSLRAARRMRERLQSSFGFILR